MSIMAPRRPPFPSAWEQSLEDQLIDARCTIAELEKRIGALEMERDEFRDGFELAHARIPELESEREELERELGKWQKTT